jgi:hypothetical protein
VTSQPRALCRGVLRMKLQWSVSVKSDEGRSAAVPGAGGSGGGGINPGDLEQLMGVAGAQVSPPRLWHDPIRWWCLSPSMCLQTRYTAPSRHTLEGGKTMVSPLFYYHLALWAIVWLFVMLHVAWSKRGVTTPVLPEISNLLRELTLSPLSRIRDTRASLPRIPES